MNNNHEKYKLLKSKVIDVLDQNKRIGSIARDIVDLIDKEIKSNANEQATKEKEAEQNNALKLREVFIELINSYDAKEIYREDDLKDFLNIIKDPKLSKSFRIGGLTFSEIAHEHSIYFNMLIKYEKD